MGGGCFQLQFKYSRFELRIIFLFIINGGNIHFCCWQSQVLRSCRGCQSCKKIFCNCLYYRLLVRHYLFWAFACGCKLNLRILLIYNAHRLIKGNRAKERGVPEFSNLWQPSFLVFWQNNKLKDWAGVLLTYHSLYKVFRLIEDQMVNYSIIVPNLMH